MTKTELIDCIIMHEEQCAGSKCTAFRVFAVVGLADGVLAVRDRNDEYTIYFDKSKCQVASERIRDVSHEVRDFPAADVGFVADLPAQSWRDVVQMAKVGLKPSGRGRAKIKWHKKPARIKYRS